MGFLKSLFGGAPKAKTTAVQAVDADEEQVKKMRTALYATKGGAMGEELMQGGTSRRETLFGN